LRAPSGSSRAPESTSKKCAHVHAPLGGAADGAHTAGVLAEVGIGGAELERLRRDGVV
jgi:hypothetical protein